MVKTKKKWYDFLWIASALYLTLGFFNILFAWLGLICFITPLMISIIKGSKAYCNKYCGRGQLFNLIGGKFKLSLNLKPPKFLSSKLFRYAFLTFFMTMFGLMIFNTVMVFGGGRELKEAVTLLWVFKLPWRWTNTSFVPDWMAQFAFGFYGVMLTSTVLGLVMMILFRPRTWCMYCPMGTMTQAICKLKNFKEKPDGSKGSRARRTLKNDGKPNTAADTVCSDQGAADGDAALGEDPLSDPTGDFSTSGGTES